MKRTKTLVLGVAIAAALAGCSTTPDRIDELETARAIVPQVEASPRAGVAAENISNARKALNTANRLVDDGGKLEDIRYEAWVANTNAQIANEKILAVQAREEVEKGTAERQQILLQAREREAQQRAAEAQLAAAQAQEAGTRAREAQDRASSLEAQLKELQAKPTERGLVLTLGDVLFDTGQATLKPGAFPTIERLATALKENPERKVMIEGHTDSRGTDEYNQSLSERRAQTVQQALVERGVGSGQVTAMGKGESFPVASNDDAGGRQANRRVELIFAQEGTQPARTASDVN